MGAALAGQQHTKHRKRVHANLDIASMLRTSSSMMKSLKKAPSAENTNLSASRADSGVWLLLS